MNNATRRQLLQKHKMSGFPGSIMEVFQAHEQGVDLIDQFQQQQMQVAKSPQERQQGLRPAHQSGNTNASMAFPDTPPNASFNTMGMKSPIDVKQFDDTGNLVKSYDAVPPGVTDLKMSSKGGTVIETPAQMQSGGLYNYDRAMELGYEPDEFGHLPSVDDQNGMWLKSAKHPTAVKELLHGYLGADHYKTHKLTANPEGYFGEDQLQYIPRKMQEGGAVPKWQNTREAISENHGPNQLGDTLDLNALDLISMERMGVRNPEATLDTIAYHETGPDQPMLSNAVQLKGKRGDYKESVGKGEFMYDKPSTLRDANRVEDIAEFMGMETPQFVKDLQETSGTSRADTLFSDQQRMLMLSNLIMDDKAPFRAYGAGDASIEDLWYEGVNRKDNEAGARQEFRNSMIRLQGDDINKYKTLGPRPNYFGRYAPQDMSTQYDLPQDYRSGGIRKYQDKGTKRYFDNKLKRK